MSSDSENEELGPSELGTKEYWDSAYSNELKSFEAHGDVGDIWFGEDSALRIVSWMNTSDLVNNSDKMVDLGCGNGMLLIELAREGFSNLIGVDYSSNAIRLANAIAENQDLKISYFQCDLLCENFYFSGESELLRDCVVALDKGTYDAISLHPQDSKCKREKYIDNIWKILSPPGIFIITSCNWTKEELLTHFTPKFALVDSIPTPSFQFGGKTGNLITSVVFQKSDVPI